MGMLDFARNYSRRKKTLLGRLHQLCVRRNDISKFILSGEEMMRKERATNSRLNSMELLVRKPLVPSPAEFYSSHSAPLS